MSNIIKIIEILVIIVMISFVGWFAISYIDVLMHNLTPHYEYPSWNLFTLLLK